MQSGEQGGSSSGVRVFLAPDRAGLLDQLARWAQRVKTADPEVVRLGLFGSYATGKYVPGSDVDLLILVRKSGEPRWYLRSSDFDASEFPVAADLFVYTLEEAGRMEASSPWFRHILSEIIWL